MPDPLSSLVLLSLSLRAPAYVLLLPFASQVVVVPFVRATYNQVNFCTHFVLLFLPARFKRIVGPNPSAPSAPIDTPQTPSLGMGLGIASIIDTVPGSPSPISGTLPLKQVGEVMDSPTEELPGAPLDALLSEAPIVPKTPDLPVKPPVPDTSSLPLPDEELMQLLGDKNSIVSAMTQEAFAASSGDDPIDPYVLTARLDQLKADNERIDTLFGLAPAPAQGAISTLPVRRQAPDTANLLAKLQEMAESGQLDHLIMTGGACFAVPSFSLCHSYPVPVTPPTPDQLVPPNSPLAYASDVAPTLPVAGPLDSTPADMLDVSAVPFPPPTSPSVIASSVPIAHDDPTMIPSAVSLPIPLAAPAPDLDAPFSLENDSGEPFAAAMLPPSWQWEETTGVESPVPSSPSLPAPPLIGARDFKPTAPTGKLSNKELPVLLAPPKEKRTSRLRFSAGR